MPEILTARPTRPEQRANRQLARTRCDCEQWAVVRRGADLWNFLWTCPSCGAKGSISWSHTDPPPHFEEPLSLPFEDPT